MAMAFCRRLRNEESENLEEIISILKQNGVRPVIKVHSVYRMNSGRW